MIGSYDLKKRQILFALSKAINTVGDTAQKLIRYGMITNPNLHLRRQDYELKRIMITHKATGAECYLVIQVDPKAQNIIRLIKGEFHDRWFPYRGTNYQWIPNSQVFNNRIITVKDPLNPKNLDFGFAGIGPKRVGLPNQGAMGTFAIEKPKSGKSEGPQIWQRTNKPGQSSRKSRARAIKLQRAIRAAKGQATDNIQLLYTLVSRQKTPAKILFYEPIHKTVHTDMADAMKAALEYTVTPRK